MKPRLPHRLSAIGSDARVRAASAMRRSVIFLAYLSAPSIVRATDPSDETEGPTLESLQKQIDELRASQRATPTIGSSRTNMKIFGRLYLDYWNFTDTTSRSNEFELGDPTIDPQSNIEWRRARIGVSGDIADDMVYKIELEFGHPDDFAFKDSTSGGRTWPTGRSSFSATRSAPTVSITSTRVDATSSSSVQSSWKP